MDPTDPQPYSAPPGYPQEWWDWWNQYAAYYYGPQSGWSQYPGYGAGWGAGWAPAMPAPPERRDHIFGIGRLPRPGDVPWGWLQTGLGLLIAASPLMALYLLDFLARRQSGDTAAPVKESQSLGWAIANLIATFLVDGWFVLWAWFFALHRYRLGLGSWGLTRLRWRYLLLIPVGLVPIYVTSGYWDWLVHPAPQAIVDMFPHTRTGFALFLLMAVGIAPLAEEIVFRGFLFQGLVKSFNVAFGEPVSVVCGVLLSAAVFSLIHFDLGVFVPLFEVGIVLAAVFYISRSLWTSIAFHAVFNFISVLAWWLIGP
jgi:membrane protease YdiL (CAAX protease family)